MKTPRPRQIEWKDIADGFLYVQPGISIILFLPSFVIGILIIVAASLDFFLSPYFNSTDKTVVCKRVETSSRVRRAKTILSRPRMILGISRSTSDFRSILLSRIGGRLFQDCRVKN